MTFPYNGELVPRAKELRKESTKQENHLWYDYLRNYPIRIQRQKTIKGFIADFYCAKAKLIIEVDGIQHSSEQGRLYDAERTAILSKYGLTVMRIANKEIDSNFDSVCLKIDKEIQKRMESIQQNP